MKRHRMRNLTLAALLVLGLSGGALAASNMPGMSMPSGGLDLLPTESVTSPASGLPAAVQAGGDYGSLGISADQQKALQPLIDQALKVEKTKQDELAKLTAERSQLATQAKPDAKRLSTLDKLIQIKQGEITVTRGQANIAFAKVVGDVKAKAVADRIFGVKPVVAQAQSREQFLDQMSGYMDQMMKQMPDLAQKNPDEALKLMTEMTKLMGQMTTMMGTDRRGMMMAPMAGPAANALPVAGPTATAMPMPNTDPNAGMSGMSGNSGTSGGMGMGMDMMQNGMKMMQQMMSNEMKMMQGMMGGGSSSPAQINLDSTNPQGPTANSNGMNMSSPTNSNSGSMSGGMMNM